MLVGSTARRHSDDTGNGRDILFREGTWIAVEKHDLYSRHDHDLEDDSDALLPQDRYYQLLLRRFHYLRTTFETARENSSVNMARITSAAADAPFLPRTERAWNDTINRASPHLKHILLLDETAIYNGLQSFATSFETLTMISTRSSSWIWSLLASVGDVGTMSHEKIGRIRDLGQKAGLMGIRLRDAGDSCSDANGGTRPAEREAVGADSDTSSSGVEMSISGDEEMIHTSAETSDRDRARARLLNQLGDRLIHAHVPPSKRPSKLRQRQAAHHTMDNGESQLAVLSEQGPAHIDPKSNSAQDEVQRQGQEREQPLKSSSNADGGVDGRYAADVTDLNTRVTIDMVLTIVTECFGQKDLLTYRQRW